MDNKQLQVIDEKGKEIHPVSYGIEIKQGGEASILLKASMNRKTKKIFFNGKEYAEFHDLQVVANYFGHSIRTYEAQPIEIGGIVGFKAHADLINKDGITIGGAEAFCLKDEPNWAKKPLFQLASMAQTRAAAKCITNVYRWVLDLAGYGTTPAEEMPSESDQTKTWPHPGENVAVGPAQIPADYSQVPGLISESIILTDMKDFVSKKGTVYYRIYDEKTNSYIVFDKAMIETAKEAKGHEVYISYEKSKFGNTIKSIKRIFND